MDDVPDRYLDALRSVYDPCCREKGISVVDMGLVQSVSFDAGQARVELLLTSGWCPFAAPRPRQVRERVEALPGRRRRDGRGRLGRSWTTIASSAAAARKLRFLPDPAAVADRDAYVAALPPESEEVQDDQRRVRLRLRRARLQLRREERARQGRARCSPTTSTPSTRRSPRTTEPLLPPEEFLRSGRPRTSTAWSTRSRTPTCSSRCRCR